MGKIKYETPIVVKVRKMTFPTEIIFKGAKVICRQCSSCHACR